MANVRKTVMSPQYDWDFSDMFSLGSDKKDRIIIHGIIRNHMKEALKAGKKTYKALAPVGDTGNLKRRGLSIDDPKIRGNVGIARFHLNEVKSKFIYGNEAKYPLFVEKGTTGPIRPKKGRYLKLRNKKTNFIFKRKEKVRGQVGQRYFIKSVATVGTNFADAVARNKLKARISAVLEASK